MKKGTKAVLLSLCAVLLVAVSIVGTVAYLTDEATVTNTFTVGDVEITLDEAKVETNGVPVAGANRVTENVYHLIPGRTYTKDPTVHVETGSEDSWLFVKVENGLAAYEDPANTILAQMTAKGWAPVSGETDVYAYSTKVSAGNDVDVFDTFKIVGTTDLAGVTAATKIVVTAYAIQAEGFDTSELAWSALKTQMNGNP